MNVIVEVIWNNVLFLYYILEAIVLFFVPNCYRMKDVKGQVVLITGAGSGIGRLMAHRFAELGCKLVLWDLNSESNEKTASEVREIGATAHTFTCDVSNSDKVYEVANKVKESIGDVDILVNNAGIVTGKKLLQASDALIRKTMDVNAIAHFWTVKAFLPAMLARNRGHVVTVASAAGLYGVCGLVDYCSSKFAAVGFHESLQAELHAQGKTGVHTTAVCPYGIDTGMFEGAHAKTPLLPILTQEYVADKIIEAVLINEPLLILPRFITFTFMIRNLLPIKAQLLCNDVFGSSTFMDEFRGRAKRD